VEFKQILGAIDAIYESAMNSSAWTRALEDIARQCHAETASIAFLRKSIQDSSFWNVGLEEAAQVSYSEHFVYRDPITPVLIRGSRKTEIATEETVIDSETLLRSEFHNDWAHPNGLRHCLVANIYQGAGTSVSLIMGRGPDVGTFQASEVTFKTLGSLLPHLRRAAQVQIRLAEAVAHIDALESCADATGHCAMLVDSTGRLLHANRPSLSGPLKTGFFSLRRGFLTSANSTLTRDLHLAIRRVCTGCSSVVPEIVHCEHDCSVAVWPVRDAKGPLGFTRNRALVVFNARESHKFRTESIAAKHRLTRAESEVLDLLVSGLSVSSIAERRLTSIGTVRNQVKAILAKLGLSRQVDVVRLVAKYNSQN
jgi:DNA-binding CsgD family transcriptional regulator